MKVVIAGSRSIKDYNVVVEAVSNSGFDISEVISGCAYGVDKLGEQWAANYNIPVKLCPADWNNLDHPRCSIKYGRGGHPYNALAGKIRNEEMAEMADAAIILWDGESKGAKNMYELAKKKGKLVYLETVSLSKLVEQQGLFNSKRIVDWAKELRENKEALALDTESTGGSFNDEIISLGVVRLHNGEVLFNQLFRPNDGVRFNKYATQVHGIKKPMLRKYPQLPEFWGTVYDLLHNKQIVAYNYSSDKRMLTQTALKFGLTMPDISWHCGMAAYKAYTNRNKNTNLTTACAELKVRAGTHDAVDDALAVARVVYRLEQEYKI